MHGDYSKLGPEAEREIQKELDQAAKKVDFEELGKAAEKGGGQAGEKFAKGFYRDAAGRLRNAKGKFVKESEALGGDLLRGIERGATGGRGRGGILGIFARLGSQAIDAFKSGFSTVKDFGGGVKDVFSKIGDVGGEIGSVLKIAGIALLVPIVIQLAGALVQLGAALFALPAAAGVAVAAFLPLIIAFQGFGEAVGAGLSGDTEKFNEALKGLAPSARGVVKELVALGPQFKSIKANVQQAFFAPLQGFFTLFGKTLLPLANKGLTAVASAMGGLVAETAKLFTTPENLATFNALFAGTRDIVKTLSPAVANLTQGFLNLIRPALPFLQQGATAFQGIAATFEKFTRRISTNGQLSGWLQKAADVASGLFDVIKELGAYIITAFGGEVGDAGRDFIHQLAGALKDLNDALKSKEGQETLHNLTTILKAFGAIVIFLIKLEPAMFKAFNLVFDGVRLVLKGLELLGGGFVKLIQIIGGFLADAGSAIANFFTKTIPSWFDAVIKFFEDLPGMLWGAILTVQKTIGEGIAAAFKFILDSALEFVGVLIGFFLSLPQLLAEGLNATIKFIGDSFQAAWDLAVSIFNAGVKGTAEIIYGIPGFLSAAWDAVKTFFSDVWNDIVLSVQTTVETGFNKVIDFFNSIPDKIRALGPKVLDAARSIGHKIADGLSEVGNFATDLGRKVTNALKTAINYVIDGINRGIEAVDEKLPVSLPRIPKLAGGAIVDKATIALVGEAGPEVVLPLSNPKRAQELADQSGLSKILATGRGAPNVNVAVYLDPSGVMIPIAKTVVDNALDQQGAELSYGVRGDS